MACEPAIATGTSSGRSSSGTIRSRARVSTARADTSAPTAASPTSASSRIAISDGSGVNGSGPSSSRSKAGTATSSSSSRYRNSALALATNTAVWSIGASRRPSMPPCSRSVTNSRFTPSTVARIRVTQSTPAARSPSSELRWRPKWNNTNTVTENSAIAGTDSLVRTSIRRSLRRIA